MNGTRSGSSPCSWASGRSSAFPVSSTDARRRAGPGGGPGPRPRRAAAVPARRLLLPQRGRRGGPGDARGATAAGRPGGRHHGRHLLDDIRTRDLDRARRSRREAGPALRTDAVGTPGPRARLLPRWRVRAGQPDDRGPARAGSSPPRPSCGCCRCRTASPPSTPIPPAGRRARRLDWVRAHAAELGADAELVARRRRQRRRQPRPGRAQLASARAEPRSCSRSTPSRTSSARAARATRSARASGCRPTRWRSWSGSTCPTAFRTTTAAGRSCVRTTCRRCRRCTWPRPGSIRSATRAKSWPSGCAGPACRSPAAGSPAWCTATPASPRSARRPATRPSTPRAHSGRGSRSPAAHPRRSTALTRWGRPPIRLGEVTGGPTDGGSRSATACWPAGTRSSTSPPAWCSATGARSSSTPAATHARRRAGRGRPHGHRAPLVVVITHAHSTLLRTAALPSCRAALGPPGCRTTLRLDPDAAAGRRATTRAAATRHRRRARGKASAPGPSATPTASVDLGGRTVELRHLGRGHTDHDLVVARPRHRGRVRRRPGRAGRSPGPRRRRGGRVARALDALLALARPSSSPATASRSTPGRPEPSVPSSPRRPRCTPPSGSSSTAAAATRRSPYPSGALAGHPVPPHLPRIDRPLPEPDCTGDASGQLRVPANAPQ